MPPTPPADLDYQGYTVCWFRHGCWHLLNRIELSSFGAYLGRSPCGTLIVTKAIDGQILLGDPLIASIFDNRIHKRRMCRTCVRQFRLLFSRDQAAYDQVVAMSRAVNP